MGDGNYWTNRLSRRSALRVSALGAVGIAGAALVGCGGDDDEPAATDGGSGSSSGGANGSSTPASTAGVEAASDEPQPGGTMTAYRAEDADTFDPHDYVAGATVELLNYSYGRLTKFKTGFGEPASGDIEPDLAESIEYPDPQTIIFHLRKDVKWDPREPTNSRLMDAEDVMQTWERFSSVSIRRSLVSHAVDESAPVESAQALDDHTVEMKLAFPDATLLQLIAYPNTAIVIAPREIMSGGAFDPQRGMRGHGPWLLEEHRPSVGFSFSKNPNWYGAPLPYVDNFEVPLILDTAQAESQFRSGALQWGGELFLPNNIASIARDVPEAEPYTLAPDFRGYIWGMNRQNPESAFNDIRVRRAVSMLINRDAFIDTIDDPAELESIGLSVDKFWNSPLSAGYGKYWLDPTGSEFGDAAKYLEHNVEEAIKMLNAAGFNNDTPMEFDVMFPGDRYGIQIPTSAEVLQAMISEGPVRPHLWSMDYTTEWIPAPEEGGVYRAHGDFPGRDGRQSAITYRPGSPKDSASGWLSFNYHSASSSSAVGEGDYPDLDDMLQNARLAENEEEHTARVHDLQRYLTDQMVSIPVGMKTNYVGIKQRGMHGPGYVQNWSGELGGTRHSEAEPWYWMDESLRS